MKRYNIAAAMFQQLLIAVFIGVFTVSAAAMQLETQRTIAVWLFDEQQALYPSKVLHDVGPNEFPLSLGRSGYIVEGKFGNALEIAEPREIDFSKVPTEELPEKFGLRDYDIPEGRTVKPMNWQNAHFAAMMTSGEHHLRRQVGFPHATKTGLNLGSVFDWTVEFWYKPTKSTSEDGVIFEIGEGPRGENDRVTRLSVASSQEHFTLYNQPSGTLLHIPSDPEALHHQSEDWHHMAFVYDAGEGQLRHYVDGRLQPLPKKAVLNALDEGYEDYFSVGRDGMWGRPLPGKLDELRFSYGKLYTENFAPPGSIADKYLGSPPEYNMIAGPPLLFGEERAVGNVLPLGNRKHLFIDDALLDESENITFQLNPPKVDQMVMKVDGYDEGEPGSWKRFRKHLNILEDEDGLIRLYTALDEDYLGVFLSRDGVNFEMPDLGVEYHGNRNIVVPQPVGTGTVIIDPNAPPSDRWKYISGYHRRGVYVFTSPDGYDFKRYKQALLPFRGATQNDIVYDDQSQHYLGYWRSGFARTPNGYTEREFNLSITENIIPPMDFTPVTAEETYQVAQEKRLSRGIPWYMDNGPFTPGKFGIEFPTVFAPDDDIDGISAGVYNPKVIKYPWAPDTFLAFPVFYFHYYEGQPGRQVLAPLYGGGPTETQFAASRDGINWKRYPRPTYVGLGNYDGLKAIQTYIGQGMVKRGDEIWQYAFVDGDYHTGVIRDRERKVYRLIQRLDGFVSADAPYERYGTIITKPVTFEGNRLVFNIDTDAHGYALVSLLDEAGNPIEGYSLEQSVMINGDYIEVEAEWIQTDIDRFGPSVSEFRGITNIRDAGEDIAVDIDDIQTSRDVSGLQGETVRVKIQMRGAKLYAMQFKD